MTAYCSGVQACCQCLLPRWAADEPSGAACACPPLLPPCLQVTTLENGIRILQEEVQSRRVT